MIPKIIHYIWVGPKRFPEDAQQLVDEWQAILPDWRIMHWTEENIDFGSSFIRQAQGVRAYNRMGNYARLAALRDHGGFYFDHDIKLIKSIEPLLEMPGVLGFQTDRDDYDYINGAVIGAPPNHPFVRRALARLDSMDGSYDWGINTGPGLLTKLLRESDDIKPQPEPYVASQMMLFPPRYFYPYRWDEEFTPECVKPDTYTVHLWEHSWKPAPGRLRRWMQFLQRVLTRLNPTMTSKWVRARDLAAQARHAAR